MSSRGTDPATERCQLRECSEKSGLDGLLADAFSAGAEVTLLGLPGLVWLMDVEPNAAVKFAALVGWVALVAAALGSVRASLALGTPVASMLVAVVVPVVGVLAVARLAVALDIPPSK